MNTADPSGPEGARRFIGPDDDQNTRVQILRAAIIEGLQGEAVPWTPELMAQISREADEMLRRGEHPDPDVCP